MKKLAVLIALLPLPAWAFLQTAPSTPDISVSATATADFKFHGRSFVDWLTIKNDCSTTLYFNINPTTKASLDYPLRLGAGESFTTPTDVRIATVSVSNDGSAACTFTLQGMYR